MTIRAMARGAGNSDDLVWRARREAGALGHLYDRHYAGVLRYCVHRLFVREAAEDVTSQVFLQVVERIRHFAGTTEQDFRNWLYAITGNQIRAYLRKRARRKALLEAAVRQGRIQLGTSADCGPELDWPTLYQAIAELTEREQTIVTLRSFEQLPFEQIAAVLEIELVTARVAFSRALKKLRARLAKSLGRA